MNEKQLHILQHSLGVDQYGRGSYYRNRFLTGPESDDFKTCRELCDMGLMFDNGPSDLCGNMHFFNVTEKGKLAMLEASPKPPHMTRSQKRYQRFLDADCGMKFGEWLKAIHELERTRL